MHSETVNYSEQQCFSFHWYIVDVLYFACRSPDGTCVLCCSNDNIMRLYNLPSQLYSDATKAENLSEMVQVWYKCSLLGVLSFGTLC